MIIPFCCDSCCTCPPPRAPAAASADNTLGPGYADTGGAGVSAPMVVVQPGVPQAAPMYAQQPGQPVAYGEQPQQIYAAAPAQPVPVQEGAYAAMK